MTAAATATAKYHPINDVRAEPSSGRFHHLLEEVAVAIKASLSFHQAMQATLELLCRHLRWPVGRVYFLPDSADTARAAPVPRHPHQEVSASQSGSGETVRSASGAGLPDRLPESREPFLLTDVARQMSSLWRTEAEAGLKAAFGFPMLVGGKVQGVLEFFSPESAKPPDELLEVMKGICRQLEQAYERDRSGEAVELRDEQGKIRAPAAINDCVVLQKKAEEALRESEERFHLLVEGVQDYAIFMLDSEGRVESWNTGAERIKGYRSQEILGQHFSRFYEPCDIEHGKPEQALAAAAALGHFEDEGWRLRKDGSRFWPTSSSPRCGTAREDSWVSQRSRGISRSASA